MSNKTTPIIALDAGHGMKTAGKRCLKSIDPLETREWYLNDRIMDMVEKDLNDIYICKVLRVDDTTGVKDVSLAARVKAANDANATVYISAHHNAGISGGNGGGTIIFYYSSKAARAAEAQHLYDAIVKQTGLVGNRSSKVIKYGYYVIKNTKMPAFLIENGFMDSRTDVPIILSEDHARKTADGIISFLVNEYKLERKIVKEEVKPNKEIIETDYYVVQPKDTLTKIGKKLGIPWKDIAGLNDIKPPYEIVVGQKLKVVATYYPAYKGKNTTLTAALTSLGIDSSKAFRKKIAAANNIKLYTGTAAQNIQMYNLLKAGLLKKA